MFENNFSRSSTARLGSRQSATGSNDIARAQVQLPPLVQVSEKGASAQLINQLKRLGVPVRSAERSYSLAECGMRSISSLGQRANARAAEVDRTAIESDIRRKSIGGDGTDGVKNSGFVAQAKKNFDRIVSDIDALTNGNGGMTTVKKGETVVETVQPRASKYYKVPLPGRPGNLTVSLVRTSGASPGLWGSTSSERPSAKTCELRSVDDKLHYSHVTQNSADDEADGTYLYVTVQAQDSECAYRLSVSFKPKKMVALSSGESPNRAHPNRNCGWMTKLREMQQQPHLREQFQDHVKMLQDQKKGAACRATFEKRVKAE